MKRKHNSQTGCMFTDGKTSTVLVSDAPEKTIAESDFIPTAMWKPCFDSLFLDLVNRDINCTEGDCILFDPDEGLTASIARVHSVSTNGFLFCERNRIHLTRTIPQPGIDYTPVSLNRERSLVYVHNRHLLLGDHLIESLRRLVAEFLDPFFLDRTSP